MASVVVLLEKEKLEQRHHLFTPARRESHFISATGPTLQGILAAFQWARRT